MLNKFKSHLITNSETFQKNKKNNLKLIKIMKDLEQKSSDYSEKKKETVLKKEINCHLEKGCLHLLTLECLSCNFLI